MVARLTIPTRLVLSVLLAEPETELYGLEVAERSGLPTGTLHPILARLEGLGWAESRWEEVDATAVGRPRRRYYHLTDLGRREAQRRLAAARPLPGINGVSAATRAVLS
jgi:PadR family transcriptional regulator, regulatory protein PadR